MNIKRLTEPILKSNAKIDVMKYGNYTLDGALAGGFMTWAFGDKLMGRKAGVYFTQGQVKTEAKPF